MVVKVVMEEEIDVEEVVKVDMLEMQSVEH